MREIKFRAFDRRLNKIVPWEDFLLRQGNISEQFVMRTNDPMYVWMQFTGLKDKNGIEVYEGDLLKSEGGRIVEVRYFFSSQFNGWDLVYKQGAKKGNLPYPLWGQQTWEVIGNIYEKVL